MKLRHIILFLLSISILSCSDSELKRVKSENLELYDIVDVNGEHEKGSLNFSESRVYDEDGKEVKHLVRQKDNSLFREAFMYKAGKLTRSNYYNSDSVMISYYTYDMEGGMIKNKKSYDAQSQELLRIETFDYDTKGQLAKKSIKDASGVISRTMAFGYDQYGNEIQVTIRDGSGKILVNEEHKITQYDVNKRWLEKWSFFDDKPLSYRIRTLDYY